MFELNIAMKFQREPITAALITAGSVAAATGANAIAQGKMNRKTIRFNREMYGIQRQDALADWQRVNDYNSPMAQMQRLREAGLNPNLVYGNGATTESQAVRSAQQGSANLKASDYSGFGNSISAYYNTKQQAATVDNLREQNNLLVKEGAVKDSQVSEAMARIGSLMSQTAKTNWEVKSSQDLFQYSLDAAKESVRKLQTETSVLQNRDIREALQNTSSLKEAVVRIAKMQAETANTNAERNRINATIGNINTDTALKNESLKLAKEGFNPNSTTTERLILKALDRFNLNPAEVLKDGAQKFEKSKFNPDSMYKKFINYNPFKK